MQNWPCEERQPAPTTEQATSPKERTVLVELPIRSYCRKLQEISGSYQVEQTCIDQEKEARAKLVRMQVPGEILAYCNDLGEISKSYQIVLTCIEQEIEAKQNLP